MNSETKAMSTNEQRYFDALKRITRYQTVEYLHKHAERGYGLEPNEVIEYAYDNVIAEAKSAISGKRLTYARLTA